MADVCTGPQGEDLCHLARGPPAVDFTTIRQKRREKRSNDDIKQAATQDPRITMALEAVALSEGAKKRKAKQSQGTAAPQQPSAIDTTRAPQTTTVDNEEEDGNTGYRQTNPRLRANTQSLSTEEMDKARMVRAGKTFYRKGAAAAQAQLDSTLSERGWQIDRELSSTEGLVLKKGEQVRVAYRGTDFTNINDLVTDASVVAGMEEKVAPQMRESRMQIEDIYTKYGKLPTELLGYSKGGAHAMAMGDHFRIPSTSYNPLVGRKQLTTKSEVPHTIIRTVEDPVSSALALAKGKKNYTVKAIDPIFGLGGPKNAHELTHFTSAGKRQPGGIEQLMHEAVRKGQTLSHFETMDHFATAREQGLSFTEALDSFNTSNGTTQRVDVLEDGTLGPRIHREAGSVKYWRDAGGTFTAAEQAHLDSNPVPPRREYSDEAQAMGIGEELTPAQRQYVSSLPADDRATFMRQQRTALQQHTALMDEAVKPHQTVIRGMMPRTSSLATGAVAGVLAHATMNVIDPEHRMNRVAEEATEGAVAGAIGVGAASALGASAALGPEVLAGAGAYVAGSESARAITSALERGGMSTDAAEAVGGMSGGAIGGVTASAVGAGATIAGSMAFGAEAGEALGIVGGPVGMAAGALGGAAIGAAIGGIGYLFSHPLFGGSHQHQRSVDEEIDHHDSYSATFAGNLATLPSIGSRVDGGYAQRQSSFANAYTNVIVEQDHGRVTSVSFDADT